MKILLLNQCFYPDVVSTAQHLSDLAFDLSSQGHRVTVIASRRGGLPEIIDHGVTGLLFDSGNCDELAHHLVALLADDDLRKRMGQNARERISVRFSRDRFVREFERLLESTV